MLIISTVIDLADQRLTTERQISTLHALCVCLRVSAHDDLRQDTGSERARAHRGRVREKGKERETGSLLAPLIKVAG